MSILSQSNSIGIKPNGQSSPGGSVTEKWVALKFAKRETGRPVDLSSYEPGHWGQPRPILLPSVIVQMDGKVFTVMVAF